MNRLASALDGRDNDYIVRRCPANVVGFTRNLSMGLVAIAVSVSAETISLTTEADTSLLEVAPQANLGAQEDLPAGTLSSAANFTRSRILFRFDLAGNLPPNSKVQSANLKLTVTRVPDGGGVNSIFSLHRLLRPWGEGAKKGNPPGGAAATTGEATWQSPFLPDQPWAVPGGEVGVDYTAAPISSERVLGTGTYEFEFGETALLEMQEWLRNPGVNFGWILISQSEDVPRSARRFGAREHADPGSRPQLTIEYSPPIPSPVITAISLTNGSATISFGAAAGVRYGLQVRDLFGSGTWETLFLLGTTPSRGELTLTNEAAPGAQRFYRILATE